MKILYLYFNFTDDSNNNEKEKQSQLWKEFNDPSDTRSEPQ